MLHRRMEPNRRLDRKQITNRTQHVGTSDQQKPPGGYLRKVTSSFTNIYGPIGTPSLNPNREMTETDLTHCVDQFDYAQFGCNHRPIDSSYYS